MIISFPASENFSVRFTKQFCGKSRDIFMGEQMERSERAACLFSFVNYYGTS
jgi:hypothetical protein